MKWFKALFSLLITVLALGLGIVIAAIFIKGKSEAIEETIQTEATEA